MYYIRNVCYIRVYIFKLSGHFFCCFVLQWRMPLAQSRLEILQVRKLINCVRMKETPAIKKLIENGIQNLVNFQGKCMVHPWAI